MSFNDAPYIASAAITNNNSTNPLSRSVYCGADDTYELFMNGAWVAFALKAGTFTPLRASGARHATGDTAPDAGDINFLY